jgi:NADP-dependent 3-hydroxy acid dehydrogenase YdfG
MALNKKITDWTDKRVWIIGASSGIGAALAQHLHASGAKVAVSARSADKLTAMVKELGNKRAVALPLDITKVDTIKAAEDKLITSWGGYDLAILMAGDYKAMRAWDIDLAVAQRMVDINWGGYLNSLSVIIPTLLKQATGGVALVSSVAGYRGLPRALVYGPTKAALINLAETLYIDLHDKNIDVYVINPGFVKTPLTDQNEFKMPHLITAEEAAHEIAAGFKRGEFEIHFPKAFSRQLKFLRQLPYSLYFKAIKASTRV